ncbi:hypothetical protein [Actinomadura sp. 9N407]|uniref:hypothetical protein n=1 Tax=Actinomadura sp. 9N407 TaxID=3375154 RepID=UPI0037B884A0
MTARTPEQDGARLLAGAGLPTGDELSSGPHGSRQIRRRLTLRADEVLGEVREVREFIESAEPRAPGRRSKKGPSPWQHAQDAWRDAGVQWKGAGAPPVRKKAAPKSPAPAPAPPSAPKPQPRDVGLRRPGHKTVAAATAGLVAIGVAAFALAGGEEETGPRSDVAAATLAESTFVTDPAAKTDGLVQDLPAVAASGATVIAAGTESAGDGTPGRDRARFLHSGDAGRTWRLARVQAADGAEPAPGAKPRMLAGGEGAWAAIGQIAQPARPAQTAVPAQTVLWTSVSGKEWTRESGTGLPFGPNDRVNALTRTSSGFVAVGATSPSGKFGADTQGMVWTSSDGRTWQRAAGLAPLGIAGLGGLAASGANVVAHGTFVRTVTKTVKRKGKKKGTRKVTTTERGDGLWRSADGGRTWAAVRVPHAQGSYGPLKGVAAGPGGIYATREGKRTTGSKKKRRTAPYGVVFGSRDGAAWTSAAQLTVPAYTGIERLTGTPTGLAALVRGKGGAGTVLHSADGRTWRPGGELGAPGPGSAVAGLAVAGAGVAVVSGHRGDDGFLAVAGPSAGPAAPVEVAKVPGAVRPERTLTALAPGAPGQLVAVGSTGGDAASWIMDKSGTWTRGRSPALGGGRTAGGPGQFRQRLNDVAHGTQGWLAVGATNAPNGTSVPLVVASQDGKAWRRTTVPGGKTTSGAASGPGGYVVVGMVGGSAAAWRSADLQAWTRGGNAGKGDLDGPTWMRDVATTGKGYVAVGGRKGAGPARGGPPPGDLPAVWTSADGLKWAAAAPPALPSGIASGAFSRVVARGDTLVALGSGRTAAAANAPARSQAFYAYSADGGRTWRTSMPAGATPTTAITAATATSKGFLVAGTTGEAGRQDVVLWATSTGADWRRVTSSGTGLDGPGDQRLTALTSVGAQVMGTGISADHKGEIPTFWKTAAP